MAPFHPHSGRPRKLADIEIAEMTFWSVNSAVGTPDMSNYMIKYDMIYLTTNIYRAFGISFSAIVHDDLFLSQRMEGYFAALFQSPFGWTY